MNFKKLLRSPILIVVLAIVVVSVGFSLITGSGYKTITTQHGLELIQDGKVASAKIIDGEQRVDLTLASADGDNGTMVQFNYVAQRGGEIVSAITAANPAEGFDDQVPQPSWLLSAFSILLPLLLIGFFIWIMFSGMQGGGNRVMQFGKSKAKLASKDSPKVTFADVAGSDEAIEELEEIKDFLKEPAKFQAVGARIPKGVLLYGPPGTGK
ncbi:cell division protein FtsH, partial [Clavibacter nebraskensis]